MNNTPDWLAECGAAHESADITGIRCELSPGHKGEHTAWEPVTWTDDLPAAAVPGRDAPPPSMPPMTELPPNSARSVEIAGRDATDGGEPK